MKTSSLREFLNLPNEIVSKLKIRLNDGSGRLLKNFIEDPSYVDRAALWYSGTWHFAEGEYFASLLKIKDDDWILTSICKITARKSISKDFVGVAYEAEVLPEYSDLYCKLHVNYHRTAQAQVRWYSGIENEIKITKLDSLPYTGEEFKGCDKVSLSFLELQSIFKLNKSTWITGLSTSKAIYLVTDKKTMKRYVGSAASDNEMLLTRWKNYATDGHGGNKYFRKVIEEKGIDYIKENFEYSILEPHDYRADTNFLIERENHWKEILHTRVDEGGMNFN